jgi:hypothetical protein
VVASIVAVSIGVEPTVKSELLSLCFSFRVLSLAGFEDRAGPRPSYAKLRGPIGGYSKVNRRKEVDLDDKRQR